MSQRAGVHAYTRNMTRALRLPALLLACFASVGQVTAKTTAAAPPPSEDLLKGPKVGDSNPRTLVAHDMMGRFQRIDGRPEEAALALLVLDPEVREAAKHVTERRYQSIREHLIDQIDLLRESSDATRAGDGKRAMELQLELFRRFGGADERSPLLADLVKLLPADAAADLTRMVDEYWTAWLAAETAANLGRPPAATEGRLRQQLFQGELTAVYNAILRPLQQKLERIYEVASVTEAQRGVIRNALIAYVKETRLRPSDAARLTLARAILAELDDGQREKVLAAALIAP